MAPLEEVLRDLSKIVKSTKSLKCVNSSNYMMRHKQFVNKIFEGQLLVLILLFLLIQCAFMSVFSLVRCETMYRPGAVRRYDPR